MFDRKPLTRRAMLPRLAGLALAPLSLRLGRARGAELLSPEDPQAKALQYTEDAQRATAATAGSRCATCALYQGPEGSTQGPCQIFPGKEVKAAGWCASWQPQI